MELQVYGRNGSETGRTVTLDDSVFGIEPNDHVVWLDVRRIQATQRQGTHKAKERGENAHSTRKLYRQKGTGYARAGSAKSPIRKSGGTIFGPRPRTYKFKLNRKTQQLARRSALAYKVQQEALRIVEDFSFDAPKTRDLVAMIGGLKLEDQKVLVLTAGHDAATHRSSRNVPKLRVVEARTASTLDLLNAQVVVLQEGALEVLSDVLGTKANAETD